MKDLSRVTPPLSEAGGFKFSVPTSCTPLTMLRVPVAHGTVWVQDPAPPLLAMG